jgi:hypothetical protein
MKAKKICGHCRVIKSTTSFTKHPATPDGLQSWCRACKSAYGKLRNARLSSTKHVKPAKRKSPSARRNTRCVNVDSKLLNQARQSFMSDLPKGLVVTDEQVIQTVLTQLIK